MTSKSKTELAFFSIVTAFLGYEFVEIYRHHHLVPWSAISMILWLVVIVVSWRAVEKTWRNRRKVKPETYPLT